MTNVRSWIAPVVAAALLGCGAGGEGDLATSKAAVVTVSEVPGRIHCSDVRAGLTELYTGIITPSGTVNVTDGTLSASLVFTDTQTFTWTSNIGVDYVLVGERTSAEAAYTNVYGYDPEATAGGPLTTASDLDVYYVKLCYDPDTDDGCTLTQGYWKTHNKYGPAKYEPWPAGAFSEDSAFYDSGKTYIEVLNTPPQGSAYYILAHQFIAAQLNLRAGASSTTAVDAAITDAIALFEAYAPTDTLTKAVRAEFIELAGILGSYNEGLTGPGHCDEEAE